VASLSDPAEAFQYAADQGWLPKKASPNETARLDGIALLLMRAFNLKGGLLYTVAKNAHYAYRDMVYQNVIRNRADPSMAVSGDYLLFMIGNVMTLTETGNDPGTEG
jgi:hypothetical protein